MQSYQKPNSYYYQMKLSHLGGLEVCFSYLCIPFQGTLLGHTEAWHSMWFWCFCCLLLGIRQGRELWIQTKNGKKWTFTHLYLLQLFEEGGLCCMKWERELPCWSHHPLNHTCLSFWFSCWVYFNTHTHFCPWLLPNLMCLHFFKCICPSFKDM